MSKLFLMTLLIALPLCAQTELYQKALQSASRSQKDKDRDLNSKPQEVLSFAEVKPGQVIADIFAGGGYFAEVLNGVVGPTGKVYLHNNQVWQKLAGEELDKRLAGDRLKNVLRHNREAENLDFGKASLDGVLMSMTFHDLYFKTPDWQMDPPAFIQQLHQAIKANGFLLIIDHAAKDGTGSTAAQDLHRIEETFVIAELEKHGFKLEKKADFLRNSKDTREISVFDKGIQGKTDRFVLLFRKK